MEFRLSGEGAGDIFSVNEFGDVLVLKKLDRESISSYRLTAQIINTVSGKELERQSEFTINVQDINDNTPEFSEPFTGSVKERAPTGTSSTDCNAVMTTSHLIALYTYYTLHSMGKNQLLL